MLPFRREGSIGQNRYEPWRPATRRARRRRARRPSRSRGPSPTWPGTFRAWRQARRRRARGRPRRRRRPRRRPRPGLARGLCRCHNQAPARRHQGHALQLLRLDVPALLLAMPALTWSRRCKMPRLGWAIKSIVLVGSLCCRLWPRNAIAVISPCPRHSLAFRVTVKNYSMFFNVRIYPRKSRTRSAFCVVGSESPRSHRPSCASILITES